MTHEERLQELLASISESQEISESGHSPIQDLSERKIFENLRSIWKLTWANSSLMQTVPFSTWGGLNLLEPLGTGAFGTVYRAWDDDLGREVALKLLLSNKENYAANQNLLHEARLLARVAHPNVIRVYGVDSHNGKAGFWMELLHGSNIQELVEDGGRLPWEQALQITRSVVDALVAVHEVSLIHRDVKAANVVLDDNGRVSLLDFGSGGLQESTGMDGPLTGTPLYLAPEVLSGAPHSQQSDIYSVGVLLYYMLSAEHPLTAASLKQLKLLHVAASEPELSELPPDTPSDLIHVIQACLAKDPTRRTHSALVLKQDLGAVEAKVRNLKGQRRFVGAALILVMFAIVLWSLGLRIPQNAGLNNSTATDVVLDQNSNEIGIKGTLSQHSLVGEPSPSSILIEPFKVRDSTEVSPYVGKAVANAIAIKLALNSTLHVLPVPEVHAVRSPQTQTRQPDDPSTPQVLLGSVMRQGNQTIITVTLMNRKRDQTLWESQQTGGHKEIGIMAHAISRQLASFLQVEPHKLYEYFRYVAGSDLMAGWPELPQTLGALRRHDVEESLQLTTRLLVEFPDEYDAHVMRIAALVDAMWTHGRQQDWDHLLAAAEALRKVDPKAPLLTFIPLWGSTNLSEQIEPLQTLLARDDLSPGCRSHALRSLGRTHAQQGSWNMAIPRLQEATRLDPANGFNYAYYFEAMEAAGKLREALVPARQAAALDPYMYTGVAEITSKLGLWKSAAAAYATAISTRTDQATYVGYAYALWQSGDTFKAVEIAKQAGKMEDSPVACYGLCCFWTLAGDETRAQAFAARARNSGIDTIPWRNEFPDWCNEDPAFLNLFH